MTDTTQPPVRIGRFKGNLDQLIAALEHMAEKRPITKAEKAISQEAASRLHDLLAAQQRITALEARLKDIRRYANITGEDNLRPPTHEASASPDRPRRNHGQGGAVMGRRSFLESVSDAVWEIQTDRRRDVFASPPDHIDPIDWRDVMRAGEAAKEKLIEAMTAPNAILDHLNNQ